MSLSHFHCWLIIILDDINYFIFNLSLNIIMSRQTLNCHKCYFVTNIFCFSLNHILFSVLLHVSKSLETLLTLVNWYLWYIRLPLTTDLLWFWNTSIPGSFHFICYNLSFQLELILIISFRLTILMHLSHILFLFYLFEYENNMLILLSFFVKSLTK